MAVHIPVGFAEAAIVLSSTSGTAPFIVTCGVQAEGTPAPVDVANNVFDAYSNAFISRTSSIVTLERVTLSFGVPGGGTGSVDSTRSAITGGDGTSRFLPFSTALILRKNTARFGRKGRGRMFMIGMAIQDDIGTDGRLLTSFQDNITLAGENFGVNLATPVGDGAPVNPVLLHDDPADTPDTITSFNCQPMIGNLRKRIR